MFCTKCGTSLPEGAKQCENCGAVVAKSESQAPDIQTQALKTLDEQALSSEHASIYHGSLFRVKAVLLAALICLFLPFVTVSCHYTEEKETYNGIDAMFGVTYESEADTTYATDDYHSGIDWFLVLSTLSCVAALVLLHRKQAVKLSCICTGFSTVMHICFRLFFFKLHDLEQLKEVCDFDFRFGYVLSLLLYIYATLALAWVLLQQATAKRTPNS